MKKVTKATLAILVGIALISVIVTPAAAGIIYVPDDYSTIQDAVNSTHRGETVIVRDGVYTENINVDMPSLTIRSENGSANCIVQAANPYDHVFEIGHDVDSVNIEGFTVKGATGGDKAGIRLCWSDECKISGNIVSDFHIGIWIKGSRNTIMNNTVTSNSWAGIAMQDAEENTITRNNVVGNFVGINMYYRNYNNIVYLNNFIDSSYSSARSTQSTNIWNSTEPITYNYSGSTYTNYPGNYWSDYGRSDTDGDGIGDTPVCIGGCDYHPLMDKFEGYLGLSAKPDLTPTAITTPENISMNKSSTITATIANVGTLDASSFNVSLSASGSIVDNANVLSLGVGNTTNVSFVWTPVSPGENELCVVADSDDAIDEVYEANNKKCIVVTVNAPDLTPTAINAPALFVNLSSTITATIDNVGTLNASTFNVSLSANGSVVDNVSVESLDAGNSTTVSFKWTPASVGNYQLCVLADFDNAIVELNETNNKKCIPVTVNAPDLTPTAINAPALFVNLPSTITATIANVGDADAGSFNVSLSANGVVVETVNVPSLSVGNSTNVIFAWTPASAGDHELCAVADYDGTITELDETNNETCIPVTVSEIPEDIVWYYGTFMPFDAERLSNNNTLITEYGNHRVIEVTPAGEIVWQYGTTGSKGSGANELNTPIDAERLSDGNTLITDSINNRVIAVDLSGEIVWQYGNGTGGNGINQLDKTRDAKPLENGNTLIVDRHNERVIEVITSDYDPTKTNNGFTAGSIVWQYGTTGVVGSGQNELNLPVDTERLENGNTLIADFRNHRVIEVRTSDYDPMKPNNGFTLDSIVWQYGTTGTEGSGVNQLNHPEDARRLSNGNTLIADYENHRVIEVRTSDYNPAKSNNGFTTRSIVWEYGSNNPADAERLENGNTLITEAANNRVIEVITPLPAELKPLTPFMLFGEVKYDNDTAIPNLTVTVKNVDTTEEFDVEIYVNVSENRSCYQVLTVSGHVLAGDVLHFVASNDNTTEFDYPVTEEDMNHGGLVRNITIIYPVEPKPDLTVTAITAYHNDTRCPAWFNLSNEIDVTVKNIGTLPAGESNVSVYIDGESWKMPVQGLNAGASETVTFENWKPIGDDCLKTIDNVCHFEWSYKDYNIIAVADCDNAVNEGDEANNEKTVQERACYDGYMADEPLENVAHGMLKGHLLYTSGDGMYTPLYNYGDTQVTNYGITIPDTATVKLAHLNVYYTWTMPEHSCPEMEVRIDGTAVPLKKAYNDIKCTCPGASWIRAWGNYVYNITDYITGNGTYTVTVKNVCTACDYFCPAAPGIVLVYEDENAPQIEYWINEGADILMGGRRYPTSSNLAWWENINNATFPASINTSTVSGATLGVVSPWGGSSWEPGMTNYLFFNDAKLGTGVYHGYSETYDKTIDSITMHVGSTNAQVGVNVTSVTDMYLKGSDNKVGQVDDGDNMMPSGAFLVVEYGGEVPPKPDLTVTDKNETLLEDGTFTVNYTVKNIGGVEAGASTTTITTSAGQSVKDSSVSALAAGASYTNTVGPFSCPCNQTLSITVCADSNDVVNESDEGNNCLTNELVCPVCTGFIEADVKFNKKRLDLNSNQLLNAFITLPDGYNVTEINVSTVECEGASAELEGGGVISGKDAFEVKFKISEMEDVPIGDAVPITVTGKLYDGRLFEGSNTLKVV